MSQLLNKKIITLIIIILAQAFLVLFFSIFSYMDKSWVEKFGLKSPFFLGIIFLLGAVLAIGAIYAVREVLELLDAEAEAEIQKTQLEESEEMLRVLRGQRHEFMDHLQVIHGLVQMDKLDELQEYLSEVTTDLQLEGEVTRIEMVELSALLLRKQAYALEQNIDMDLIVESTLIEFPVDAQDICRIMGNLIDNAIYAVEELKDKKGHIEVIIEEDGDDYAFSVINNGPPVPEEIKAKIFEMNYTTKGSEGSGLGLHIVKTLIKKYEGKLHFHSDVETTEFTIRFHKKQLLTLENNQEG